jgi:bifunctional non-homologous end joining protein LigD
MSETTIELDGRVIELSSQDKVLFPDCGISKGDLVDYYRRIALVALPHWRDRPTSLQRFPDGIDQDGFFQKDAPDYFPDWIAREELKKEGGSVEHVLVNDAATAVYLANQGCITLHLGLSRVDRIDRPDRLILDLDPAGDDFTRVQDAARLTRELLDELELPSFVQTTGSRGLHVVVPLDRSAGFDAVRDFAHRLAARLAERHPDRLTAEQRKAARRGRVFIDYLRNAYGQTAVAPYAVRAKPGAPVATPLDWDEALAKDQSPTAYTIQNIFQRLGQKADPWRHIDDAATSLAAAARQLDSTGDDA